MNTKLKEVIAASLSIVFILLLFIPGLGNLLSPIGGIWNSSNQANYPKYMEIQDSSLDGEVLAYRDHLGIPHIYVTTEADFAFAVGYLQAQDRLFSMDIQRRFVEGRVAELVGSDYIGYDIESRLIGFGRLGEQMYNALLESNDPDTAKIIHSLQRFCDGINRYIKDISPNKLPMEYLYLGIKPELWDPIDICKMAKYMAYMLSFFDYDLQTTVLAEAFGKEVMNDVMPVTPFSFDTPVIPNFTTPEDTGEILVKGTPQSDVDLETAATLAQLTLEKMTNLESWVQIFGGCSNNWVVNGSLTTTGYPILCGDPHLMLMLPSIWWEFHYVNIMTGESLYGVAFPGTPLCEIGANNLLAWSATITAIDCVDYYIETLNGAGTQYLFNKTEWRKIEQVTEVIKVKGEADYRLIVNFTRHNYVGDNYSCPIYATYKGNAVSVKWTGLDPDPGLLFALYKMTHARNITEFSNAVSYHTCPGQNFVCGTVQGDIGMFPYAKYPVRNATGSLKDNDGIFKGIFMLNGSNGEDEWTGYIPYEWVPHKINPDEQMYLASANQRTVNASEYQQYYLSYTFADGYRARAINRYLSKASTHSITVEDMQRLQADNFDVAASEFIPILLEYVNSYYSAGISDPLLNQTVEILTTWNETGTYADRTEIAPTIWDEFINTYLNQTFYDEYTTAGILGYVMPRVPALENMTRYNPTSHWFNNTFTPQTENSSDIMLLSLNISLLVLESKLGSDITKWKWGSVHQMDIQYLMGIIPEFNIPKYPADGNEWTINVAGGHSVQEGPSMRMIIDFSNLAKNETYVGYLSYPGGQSGNPISPHYRDIFELWKNYQYHAILFPLSISEYPTDYIEATAVFKP
ncbi:MAG TPA: penicillin acylase family protein [Candidatus Deferrimicrobium sp.]|nr:penicillin acylase family protein [Candidatus Deferrimicrobium sp.]